MPDQETEQQGAPESEGIKQLRDANKRKDQQIADLERTLRNQAFRMAGLDPTSPSKAQAAFMAQYQGELDSGAIRAEAVEWGIVKEQEEAASPLDDPRFRQYLEQYGKSVAGVAGGTAADLTAEEQQQRSVAYGIEQFRRRVQDGTPRANAADEVMQRIFRKAQEGDPMYRYDRQVYRDALSQR